MRCYHSFSLNTKNKTQDKHKALSFTKRKPNEKQVQERKTKLFFKVATKSLLKNALNKTETLRSKQ